MKNRWVLVLAIVTLVGAACGNAGSSDDGGDGGGGGDAFGPRSGVTDSVVRIGAVAAETSPLGDAYSQLYSGIEAYMNMVDDAGGVHGYTFELVDTVDDQNSSARNGAAARKLVEEDRAFAVMVASPNFGGADYLVEHSIPTFGWNINPEWSAGPNLFGEKGSYLEFAGSSPQLPWMATEVAGAGNVGILSYSHVQSAACAEGQKNSYTDFGLDVAYENTSLQFGFTDLTADVERMRDAGITFLSTCMDAEGNARVAQAIDKAGLDIQMYWPNGYDREFLDAFADAAEGVYLGIFFVPFEVENPPPGMATFLEQMEALGEEPTEVALAGWLNMDMLTKAIEAVGPEFTRQSVIDEINTWDDYTGDGIQPVLDWTVQHEQIRPQDCVAYVRAEDGQFVPQYFGEPGKPFVCFPQDTTSLDTVEFKSFG